MDITKNKDLYESSLVKIRFVGNGLAQQGIPIYELGQSFVAFQRIINKAYLFQEGRLAKGATLTPEERKKCALQILSRKRESDGYGLTAFLTDPVYGNIAKGLIILAVAAIGSYVRKKIFPLKDKPVPNNQPLVGSIRNEINIFVDRIGNIGGANSIQISAGKDMDFETLNIDKGTQKYVRGIVQESFLGEVTTIEGIVTRIHPRRMTLDIRDKPSHYITVRLSENDFNKVRKSTNLTNYMRFTGRPIFLVGTESEEFSEFEAYDVTITKRESE